MIAKKGLRVRLHVPDDTAYIAKNDWLGTTSSDQLTDRGRICVMWDNGKEYNYDPKDLQFRRDSNAA